MNEKRVEFTPREKEPEELYPLTDICRSFLEEQLEDKEVLPQEIEEGLLDLQDLEEESLEDALVLAFTFLLECGVDDPEAVLIEKGILEETEIGSES